MFCLIAFSLFIFEHFNSDPIIFVIKKKWEKKFIKKQDYFVLLKKKSLSETQPIPQPSALGCLVIDLGQLVYPSQAAATQGKRQTARHTMPTAQPCQRYYLHPEKTSVHSSFMMWLQCKSHIPPWHTPCTHHHPVLTPNYYHQATKHRALWPRWLSGFHQSGLWFLKAKML